MKVLFINSNLEKEPYPVMPTGLCIVASSLKGYTVSFLDLTFENNPEKAIKKRILAFKPDYICIGIRNIDSADYLRPYFYLNEIKERIIKTIKKCSEADMIIGGSAVGVSPVKILEYLDLDYAICGEGEESLNELIDTLQRNKDLSKIKGAVYKQDGKIVLNDTARVKDLTKINFSDVYRFINVRKYARSGKIGIQTKRGCSFNCVYCTYNKIEGKEIRLRPAKQVVDDISRLIEYTGIKNVEFTDSVFNFPLEHAIKICRQIIKRGIRANFSTMGINPKYVTKELIFLLEKAGFNEIYITPESASQPVIDGLRKGFRKSDIIHAKNLLENSTLNIVWFFMFGGPNESKKTFEETIDFINQLPKNQLIVTVAGIRIYEGTELADLAVKEGMMSRDTDLLHPVFYHSGSISSHYIEKRISELIRYNSNILSLSTTRLTLLQNTLRPIAESLLRFMGSKTPSWQYLIAWKKLRIFLLNLVDKGL